MGQRVQAAVAKSPERFALPVAEAVLRESLGMMDPQGILVSSGGWDSYCTEVWGMLDGQPIADGRVVEMRMGLEYLKAPASEGDFLICAAKMCLSAWVLASLNHFAPILEKRHAIHDDIDPLLQRGVFMLATAEQATNPDYSVEWDEEVIPAVHHQHQQGHLAYLIKTAVRPTDVDR
jgi:hypothetical protein